MEKEQWVDDRWNFKHEMLEGRKCRMGKTWEQNQIGMQMSQREMVQW